jgi:hypothetical protein
MAKVDLDHWKKRKKPGSKGYGQGGARPHSGPKPKEASLTKNTSPSLSPEERKATNAAIKEEKARQKKQEKINKEIQELNLKLSQAKAKLGISDDPGTSDTSGQNISTDKMIQDLRWAYSQLNGRQKLKEMMADDKQFSFIVKELLRLEAAEKEKDKGGSSGMGFFVIIRGLNDEKALSELMGDVDKNEISSERVKIIMTNPDGSEAPLAAPISSEVPAVDPKDALEEPVEEKPVEENKTKTDDWWGDEQSN